MYIHPEMHTTFWFENREGGGHLGNLDGWIILPGFLRNRPWTPVLDRALVNTVKNQRGSLEGG